MGVREVAEQPFYTFGRTPNNGACRPSHTPHCSTPAACWQTACMEVQQLPVVPT